MQPTNIQFVGIGDLQQVRVCASTRLSQAQYASVRRTCMSQRLTCRATEVTAGLSDTCKRLEGLEHSAKPWIGAKKSKPATCSAGEAQTTGATSGVVDARLRAACANFDGKLTRTARSASRCARKRPGRFCQSRRAYRSAGSHRRCGTRDGLASHPSVGGRAIQAAVARRWRSAAPWPLSAGSCRTDRSETGAASP